MNVSAKNLIFILLAFSTMAQAQEKLIFEQPAEKSGKSNMAKTIAQWTGAVVTLTAATIGALALAKYKIKSDLQTLLAHNRMQYAPALTAINNMDEERYAFAEDELLDITQTLEPLAWNGYHAVQTINQINLKINTMQQAIFASHNASHYSLHKLPDAMIQELNDSIRDLIRIRNFIPHSAGYREQYAAHKRDIETQRDRQHERELRRDEFNALQTAAHLQQPKNTVIVNSTNGGK